MSMILILIYFKIMISSEDSSFYHISKLNSHNKNIQYYYDDIDAHEFKKIKEFHKISEITAKIKFEMFDNHDD